MEKVLTLQEFKQAAKGIQNAADRRVIELRYNAGNGWYKAVGTWGGVWINTCARTYASLRSLIQFHYGVQIPRKSELIFSHQANKYRFAAIQACIPGTNCVIDCSAENRRANS